MHCFFVSCNSGMTFTFPAVRHLVVGVEHPVGREAVLQVGIDVRLQQAPYVQVEEFRGKDGGLVHSRDSFAYQFEMFSVRNELGHGAPYGSDVAIRGWRHR